MKGYWLTLASGVAVSGCMVSNGLQYEAISETNHYHIARLRKGMSEKQVLQIMHKPYSYETFQVEEDIYDVWFYVTRPTGLDQTRMVPQNLTPLTFKNGVLVGTGYNWYYYAMKEQAAEAAAQAPQSEVPKSQESEDIEFEKALKTPPSGQSTSSPMTPSPSIPPAPPAPTSPSLSAPTMSQMSMGPSICPPEKKLSQIVKGMTETQVFRVMGEPIQFKTFELGGDTYDIWFYETVPNKTGRPSIVPQQTTPLIFKNAFLISMSQDKYFELKETAEQEKGEKEEAASNAVEEPVEEEEETPPCPEISQPEVPSPAESPEPTVISKGILSLIKPWEPPAVLGVNPKTFSQIQLGMSETEVTNLLGAPSNYETFQINQDVYDVWFYEVAPSKKKEVSKRVPLTFKNAVLVGMTQDYYDGIREGSEERVNCYDQKGDRMQEDESEQNFNFW